LLGQMRGFIEHCRDLEGRYRDERIHLATLDTPLRGAAKDRRDQAERAGGSSAAACG
jgi:hypothetical protein